MHGEQEGQNKDRGIYWAEEGDA